MHSRRSTGSPMKPYIRVRFCFFFQAEDGIRDKLVTGVQTCALPICNAQWIDAWDKADAALLSRLFAEDGVLLGRNGKIFKGPQQILERQKPVMEGAGKGRSEERRVGKECRSRWSPYH